MELLSDTAGYGFFYDPALAVKHCIIIVQVCVSEPTCSFENICILSAEKDTVLRTESAEATF